jgi:hypothetical protein
MPLAIASFKPARAFGAMHDRGGSEGARTSSSDEPRNDAVKVREELGTGGAFGKTFCSRGKFRLAISKTAGQARDEAG